MSPMRLRTMESFGLINNGIMYSYPYLQGSHSCDILVVGAGITGALVSHSLRKSGYKVLVVDKCDVGFGSTAATTSLLQYEIDEPLTKLREKIGKAGADLCYLEGIKALKDIERLVRSEKIDCSFQKKKSLFFTEKKKELSWLKEEYTARREIGIGVQWLTSKELLSKYGLRAEGAILSQDGASVDAYKMTHELFHKNSTAKINPIKIFDQSPIKNVKEVNKQVVTTFVDGGKITSKKIVYCSGFAATEILKEKVADLFDTYVCISEIFDTLPAVFSKTILWNTSDPYLYMRSTEDGRVLVGGEDSSFRMGVLREKIKKYKMKTLIRKFSQALPGIDFVEDFTWAGTFGKTKDGLPYVGESPEFKHTYFVLGFGGNGIIFSAQAMRILPDLLEDKVSSLAHYYRFGR